MPRAIEIQRRDELYKARADMMAWGGLIEGIEKKVIADGITDSNEIRMNIMLRLKRLRYTLHTDDLLELSEWLANKEMNKPIAVS